MGQLDKDITIIIYHSPYAPPLVRRGVSWRCR